MEIWNEFQMEKQDDTIDFNFERKIIKIQRKKKYKYNRYYIDRILHTDNKIPFSFYL